MKNKLGNKGPNLGESLKSALNEAIEYEKGNVKLRTTKRQWCNDIDAQKIIENHEETIRFLGAQARTLKKQILELQQEIENIGPAMKRQQATIVELNEQIYKLKGGT